MVACDGGTAILTTVIPSMPSCTPFHIPPLPTLAPQVNPRGVAATPTLSLDRTTMKKKIDSLSDEDDGVVIGGGSGSRSK